MTIKERNCGVVIKGKSRVVDESTPCVANMNCVGLYDGKSELLEGVNGGGWGRVGMAVEGTSFGEGPIMVGDFEDAFWARECGDFGVHQGSVGFSRCK